MLEPVPSENCRGLTMKLKVKYPFLTSSSGAKFFIHQFSECLEIENISTCYQDAKVSTKQGANFLNFHGLS